MKDKSILKKEEKAELLGGYEIIHRKKLVPEKDLEWCRLWNAFYSELLKETNDKS